ncbi:MAG: peptidylprolyl isomerase [Candidatus Omnitrophica bacterium]|nr:peptidylprolyl isomerase [Candidatus Omnitrophota bacterium]
MKIFSGLVLFISLYITIGYAESQMLDQVVAVVNNEAITQSELDLIFRPVYEEYKNNMSGEQLMATLSEARRKLLNQLVEDRLVLQEAKSQNIEVSEDEVERDFKEFVKRYKTEEDLEQALYKEGLNLTLLRERLKNQAMIRQLHDREIRARVIVSPLEVEDYFKNHPQEFASQDRVKVRSLTLKKGEEARLKGLTDEGAKTKIETLRNRIMAGEDFETLAKENSEDAQAKNGGLGDWVERGEMIPVIDQVIFSMKPQEYSDIVETEMGYHFFRLEMREEGKKRSFEEVRDEIFGNLFRRKVSMRFREWMNELRREAYISIR